MKTLFERMTEIARGGVAAKADYVRARARQAPGNHTCHWPGCTAKVPPAMWGCKTHWFRLPNSIRTRLWSAYRPGQEIAKNPSHEYVEAMHEAQEWAERDERRVQMINRG
jgi:hypothetical protein